MPKLLIGVKSCAQDAASGFNDVIRETWGKDTDGATLAFFAGQIAFMPPSFDEVRLPCPDGYYALPLKTRAILAWSLQQHYEFTFLCDTDTFVRPKQLLTCGFERYDLTGYLSPGILGEPRARDGYWAWPSGGAGYWISAKAARLIVDSPAGAEWAEDRMIGQILGPYFQNGTLTGYDCPGFHKEGGITLHYESRGQQRDFDPQWMRDQYRRNGGR